MQLYLAQREAPRAAAPPVSTSCTSARLRALLPPAAQTAVQGRLGKPLDPDAAAAPRHRLYGRAISKRSTTRGRTTDRYGLRSTARPNSWGPNYVRFGLNLQDDFEGNSTYNAAARFVLSESRQRRANGCGICRSAAPRRSPRSCSCRSRSYSGCFVVPHVADRARNVDVLDADQEPVAEYRVHIFDYRPRFRARVRQLGRDPHRVSREEGHYHSQVRRPERSERCRTERDPSTRPTTSCASPTTGSMTSTSRTAASRRRCSGPGCATSLGMQPTSDQVALNYIGAHSFGRDTVQCLSLGRHDAASPVTDISQLFPLGGFLNLSGLRPTRSLGPHFGIARLLYYRQIGRGGARVS